MDSTESNNKKLDSVIISTTPPTIWEKYVEQVFGRKSKVIEQKPQQEESNISSKIAEEDLVVDSNVNNEDNVLYGMNPLKSKTFQAYLASRRKETSDESTSGPIATLETEVQRPSFFNCSIF
ncbi:hypothetical protein CHUAL_011313 [Chamberlinius hualienensis]